MKENSFNDIYLKMKYNNKNQNFKVCPNRYESMFYRMEKVTVFRST